MEPWLPLNQKLPAKSLRKTFYEEMPKDAESPIVVKEGSYLRRNIQHEERIEPQQQSNQVEGGEPRNKTYPKRLRRHSD